MQKFFIFKIKNFVQNIVDLKKYSSLCDMTQGFAFSTVLSHSSNQKAIPAIRREKNQQKKNKPHTHLSEHLFLEFLLQEMYLEGRALSTSDCTAIHTIKTDKERTRDFQ